MGSLLLAATPAWSNNGVGGGGHGTHTGGNNDGSGGISAEAGVGAVQYDTSKNGSGSRVGGLAPVGNYEPPACWYAPKYTPDQLKAEVEPIWEAGSTGSEWDNSQRDRYVNGKPYKDFNKDKEGKGYWWDSYVNEDFPPGWDACDKPYFWVDNGDPPPPLPQVISTEILGKLAYKEVQVPTRDIRLAPAGTTKVNLPTWAWLDGADFKPVSVTASVPVLNLSATTTAEPVSLKIEPGGDAETYPASGECEIVNGRIGVPYAKGKADQTPPCGVKYLRSSGNGSYALRATVTWKISWTGSDGDGGGLGTGTFGNTQNVTVQEIQSVNR